MCGRISLFAELGDLASQFRFAPEQVAGAYCPSWNIAPTAAILAVMAKDGIPLAAMMRWGFSFRSRDGHSRDGRSRDGKSQSSRPLFNARSETLAQRPAFRGAFAHRRCLIPINGFYEWRSVSGGKAPVWVHRSDQRPFALAGIYNDGPDAAASIITCQANSLLSPIHHRMPAMLDESAYGLWLDPNSEPSFLEDLLAPREWQNMSVREVSGAVNRASNDGPHLIEPASTAVGPLL